VPLADRKTPTAAIVQKKRNFRIEKKVKTLEHFSIRLFIDFLKGFPT
jgi:hypothetical protein